MPARHLATALALALLLAAAPNAWAQNPAPPVVTAKAAKSITRTSAAIPATIDPNRAATSFVVEYGTTKSYGLTSAPRGAGSGDKPVSLSITLTGLTPNTPYHYRVVARNAAGITRSGDRKLRTKNPPKPLVTLGAAGGLTTSAISLAGTVNPRGGPTRYRFRYGKAKKLDKRTKLVAAGAGSTPVPVGVTLKLAADTSYSYQLVATNAGGTTRSARRTFRTPGDCRLRYPAKLSIARASTPGSMIDTLAPISSRASGRVSVEYHAAQRRTRLTIGIDRVNRRIRFRRRVPDAQARMGTGILTIGYPGDADTQPQSVRLRAAARKALLDLSRPQIAGDRVRASGTISSRARGVVRLQLQYQFACTVRTLRFTGAIAGGRWSINEQLGTRELAEIAARKGAVHSTTLFTGYLPARMRGEMRSFEVLGSP